MALVLQHLFSRPDAPKLPPPSGPDVARSWSPVLGLEAPGAAPPQPASAPARSEAAQPKPWSRPQPELPARRDEGLHSQAGPGRQSVCGLGYADSQWLAADVPKPWDQSRQDEVKRLRDHLLPLLRHSADPADQVAAALLARPLWDVGLGADSSSHAAALLAQHSHSAAAYGLAYRACATWPGAACSGLSARRWTELDEQNPSAWLFLLGEAYRAADAAVLAEALYRLSLPQLGMDPGMPLLARAQARMAQARAQALDTAALASEELALVADAMLQTQIIGVDFAMTGNWLQALNRSCSGPALADSNRQQQCQAVARNLLLRGRSLMDMAQALSLAERSGLPAAEWPLQRSDYLAVQAQVGADSEAQAELGESCAAFRLVRSRLAEILRQGEWGFWRAELARQRGAASAPVPTPTP
ncbi:hypothetical protein HNP55_002250 [Paucibacter oligotrophus]|uniref:Uncharacterized protein n=1 Tax=Roseateles oligotrophus TaxID=1769250 RepID=A0A840LEJ7_9BURK|nr:hypothetical protein [Roseateles oligotrophus]MBB4843727.1 hypothetical protein [Roseateles oligotrophus]